jgi:hypothetical protein
MDTALILADQILTLLRNSGATRQEAYAALSVANDVMPTVEDMIFKTSDLPRDQTLRS